MHDDGIIYAVRDIPRRLLLPFNRPRSLGRAGRLGCEFQKDEKRYWDLASLATWITKVVGGSI